MKRQHRKASRLAQKQSTALVLTERCATVDSQPIRYTLLANRHAAWGTVFWIRIQQPHIRRTVYAGVDCDSALFCFDAILRGTVTAYTLADVLQDLQSAPNAPRI